MRTRQGRSRFSDLYWATFKPCQLMNTRKTSVRTGWLFFSTFSRNVRWLKLLASYEFKNSKLAQRHSPSTDVVQGWFLDIDVLVLHSARRLFPLGTVVVLSPQQQTFQQIIFISVVYLFNGVLRLIEPWDVVILLQLFSQTLMGLNGRDTYCFLYCLGLGSLQGTCFCVVVLLRQRATSRNCGPSCFGN